MSDSLSPAFSGPEAPEPLPEASARRTSVPDEVAEADALLARRITRPSPWEPGASGFPLGPFPGNF